MLWPEATIDDYTAHRPAIDAMATKIVTDMLRLARVDAIMKYKKGKGEKIKRSEASSLYLKAGQYVRGRPDWMDKCPRAWRDLSRMWASDVWIEKSRRNRENRDKNPEICTTHLGGHGMGHLARDLVSTFF